MSARTGRLAPHLSVGPFPVYQVMEGGANNQHLYFTTPSETAGGEHLVFISDRSGSPNLWVLDRNTDQVSQLSFASEIRKSYVYPTGGKVGFAKPSPSLDAQRGIAYWIEDDSVWRRSLASDREPEKLGDLPVGWVSGYTSLNSDGSRLCVPVADPRAFLPEDRTQHDQLSAVPWRMLSLGAQTCLVVFDTTSGAVSVRAELPFWVTHVQFDPQGEDRILCNSEGGARNASQNDFPYWGRLWGVMPDGSWDRLAGQSPGRSANHENWTRDGHGIVIHGRVRPRGTAKLGDAVVRAMQKSRLISPYRLRRFRPDYVEIRTWDGDVLAYRNLAIPVKHAIASGGSMKVVVDSADGYIYLLNLLDEVAGPPARIARHGSSYEGQDSHPHPVTSQGGDRIVFTSDVGGTCNIFEVRCGSRA